MTNPQIAEAIAAAQAAAANTVDLVPTTVVGSQPGTQVASYGPPVKPTMNTAMQSAGIRPDIWLKASEHGLTLGADKKTLYTEILVEMDLTEDKGFYVKTSIRFGNPAQYFSTYDGETCDKGGSWASALTRVQSIDPKAKPFYTADFKATIVESPKTLAGKPSDIPAGKVLGHTLSLTNFREFQEFYEKCVADGYGNQRVLVKLGSKMGENTAGNTWGLVTFELVGPVA